MKEYKHILLLEENAEQLNDIAVEINVVDKNRETRDIVSEIKKTMKVENLTSLSAPAIGINKRIFCIRFKEEIKTFINPQIVKAEGLSLSKENCTSIPGKTFLIPRSAKIDIAYQRPTGNLEFRQLIGVASSIFQHEMQHLDGITLVDLGLEIDEDYENATEEEQQEIIKMYLESLDIRQKDIEENIKNDPEASQIMNAIDYMTSINSGNTKLDTSSNT